MRLFTDHPRAAGQTYSEHAQFAFRFSGACFLAAGAAMVHAVFPFLFKTTASEKIIEIHDALKKHGRISSET